MSDHSISRRSLMLTTSLAPALRPGQLTTRDYWLSVLERLADPVLHALSQGKLKALMPVEAPAGNERERRQFTHLEAIGRLLCGISPWLESSASRNRYAELARRSIAQAVDPASPDFLNFSRGSQPLVDAAFLALAVLRAPVELWQKLDPATQKNLVSALRSTRIIRPGPSNWLLFSATIEAFFCRVGEPWDGMRVDYAVRQHNEWYRGDGAYGDGANFHFDYYNSFVIHPMLLQVVETTSKSPDPVFLERSRRYAAVQERLIGPDGSFPPIGRSLAYRFGAFHLLADMVLRRQLPEKVTPEQVREALTSVIRRMIEAPGTFDERGWLQVGFCGHQPEIAERYISTGSLYLCAAALLPLGLPAADPFWSNPPKPWTAKRAWNGGEVAADHAL